MEFPNLTKTRRRFLEHATASYVEQLAGSPAEVYLKETRGFTDELIQHFRLGYIAEPVEGHDAFRGRIAIPYVTPAGVVAIRFRRMGESGPKFLQEAGSDSPLYNVLDLHRPEPYIAICEGEPDTQVMSGLCGVPTVGIPGVDTWGKNTDIWRRLFEDYERIFVVTDPDDPGQKVAQEIMRVVQDPTNVILPADVNDTYLTFGPEFIRDKCGLEQPEHV